MCRGPEIASRFVSHEKFLKINWSHNNDQLLYRTSFISDHAQTTTSASTTKDPYHDWPMEDFFKEDTLVMESSIAVPMVHQFTMACLPPSSDGSMDEVVPLQHQRIGGRRFMDTGKVKRNRYIGKKKTSAVVDIVAFKSYFMGKFQVFKDYESQFSCLESD